MSSVYAHSHFDAPPALRMGPDGALKPERRSGARLWLDRVRCMVGSRTSQKLVGERYRERGLQILSRMAPEPGLLTLQAMGPEGLVGTLSVRVDGLDGLAADAVFPESLAVLREAGWRLCEFTRLAVQGEQPSKEVLAGLFHMAHLFAYRLRGATMLIMEVHPRHAPFYRRMLGARVLMSGRDNPSVRAPSVLMALELAEVQAQVDKLGGRPEMADVVRSLYPFAYSPADEPKLLERLRAEQ